jgi:hypothetical protein
MINENPRAFLAPPFGVPVAWGAIDTFGILDMPSNVVAGGMVITTDYKLTFETASLPGLDFEDVLYVDGARYEVRIAKPVGDGVFSEAELTKK